MKKMIVAASAVILLQTVVSASPITVNNYSFESPDNGADVVTTAGWLNLPDFATSGWSYAGGGWGIQDWTDGVFAGTTGDAAVASGADGNQGAYVNFGSTIYQDVGALAADTQYTLTVAVGDRLDKNYTDTIILGFYQNDLGTALNVSGTLGGDSIANGDHDDFSFSFSTGASVAGNLVIAIQNPGTGGHTIVDNVRLDAAAIPEPATLGLVGLFGAGILFIRRRLTI